MKVNAQNFEFLHCDFNVDTRYLNILASFGSADYSPVLNTSIKLHHHAVSRMKQRGISFKSLALVLLLAEPTYKQNLTFYFVGNSNLYVEGDLQLSDKTKNIVVLVDENNQVITLYKNEGAAKNIRKKSGYLVKPKWMN